MAGDGHYFCMNLVMVSSMIWSMWMGLRVDTRYYEYADNECRLLGDGGRC